MHCKFVMIGLLASAALVAGCSGPVETIADTSDAVMVKHTPDTAAEAERRAQSLCANYGKKARVRDTHNESTVERLSTYDCVPM